MIPNLEWMRNAMLIVSGLSFCISSLQHFLCLFLDVVDLVSKLQFFFNFSSVGVGVIRLCQWTDQVDGRWGLKSITYLKWTLSHRAVLSTIVTVLYIWDTSISCLMMLVVVHVEHLYYQEIHNFCLSICLRMESCWFRESHVELLHDILPKDADKYKISVKNDGHR